MRPKKCMEDWVLIHSKSDSTLSNLMYNETFYTCIVRIHSYYSFKW